MTDPTEIEVVAMALAKVMGYPGDLDPFPYALREFKKDAAEIIAALDAHRQSALPEDVGELVKWLRIYSGGLAPHECETLSNAADAIEALATHAANCERLMHKAHGDHSIAENLLAKEFARAEKAEAELAEARKALEPFARYARHYPTDRRYGNRPTSGALFSVASGELGEDEITVEDVHRAAAITKAEATHG